MGPSITYEVTVAAVKAAVVVRLGRFAGPYEGATVTPSAVSDSERGAHPRRGVGGTPARRAGGGPG